MIKLIGIELEGGWDEEPPNSDLLKEDSSVEVDADYYIGEMASRPLTLNHWKSWLVNNYPDHVNHTCGLHIHMSFGSINDYVVILENAEKYQKTLINNLTKWGKYNNITNKSFWNRLKGNNSYCALNFDIDNILLYSDSDASYDSRHKAINFCAFNKHGTLEIRILSAFYKKEWAVKAIEVIIQTTNSFLKTKIKKLKQFTLSY